MDWDQAYRGHSSEVFRYLYYRTSGNKDLSADLTQDVFVRAMRAQQQFTDDGRGLTPWLTTIARNLLHDHYKNPRRQREDLVDAVPDHRLAESAEDEALQQLAAATVMRAVGQLEHEQREAVVLSCWGRWPDERIGQLMGVRANTVRTRRFRAREILRRRLAEVA